MRGFPKKTAVQVTIILGVVQGDLATAHVHHGKFRLGADHCPVKACDRCVHGMNLRYAHGVKNRMLMMMVIFHL